MGQFFILQSSVFDWSHDSVIIHTVPGCSSLKWSSDSAGVQLVPWWIHRKTGGTRKGLSDLIFLKPEEFGAWWCCDGYICTILSSQMQIFSLEIHTGNKTASYWQSTQKSSTLVLFILTRWGMCTLSKIFVPWTRSAVPAQSTGPVLNWDVFLFLSNCSNTS